MNNRTAIPKHIRQQVLERDDYRCRYCGKRGERFHMDHVYPVSKGGETSVNNLVTACPACNTKKQARVGVWPHDPMVAKRIGEYESKKDYGVRLSLGIATIGNIISVCGFAVLVYALSISDSYVGIAGLAIMWIGISASAVMMWHEKKTR